MRAQDFLRPLFAVIASGLVASTLGCSVFSSPDREYRSNERVLDAVAGRVGYVIDDDFAELTRVEIEDDVITFHYRGVEYPGDQAWVVRFSEKSTELEPESLATVASAIEVIRDENLQRGFEAEEARSQVLFGVEIEFAAYTFDSALAPSGREGRGLLVALRRVENGLPVIYQIKLDNHGDRERLSAADLAPFLTPFGAGSSDSP